MQSELPRIEDKMDVESAVETLAIGYPNNQDALEDLIFWSCFPNDPVCRATFPYVHSLRDEVLAPAMAKFIEFHHNHQQTELVTDAFWLFINERGEGFRSQVLACVSDAEVRALFSLPEYSLDQYASDCDAFDALSKASHSSQTDPETRQSRRAENPPCDIKDEFDVDGVKQVVAIGYPQNEALLDALIFWACFPDKPVCAIAFPYIRSLRGAVLAPAMAEFIESCVEQGHSDLIADAFALFINERGEDFRSLIISYLQDDNAKALFSLPEYSLEQR